MSRLAALVVALVAFASAALAQPNPAPTTHPGTTLNFPATLAGATFEQGQSQGTGATYMYTINKMQIYVFIFDGGRRVPPGSDSPLLLTRFSDEVDQAQQQLKTSGYGQFERPAVPSSCTYGSVTFRCIVYSVNSMGGRLFSKLLMTGYRDYFLKIRIDWAQANNQSHVDADKVLQAFVPALVH